MNLIGLITPHEISGCAVGIAPMPLSASYDASLTRILGNQLNGGIFFHYNNFKYTSGKPQFGKSTEMRDYTTKLFREYLGENIALD